MVLEGAVWCCRVLYGTTGCSGVLEGAGGSWRGLLWASLEQSLSTRVHWRSVCRLTELSRKVAN